MFVCGNARTIAPAVRAALTAIHHQHAGGSVAEDEGWLASLRADGRYLEDIWGG